MVWVWGVAAAAVAILLWVLVRKRSERAAIASIRARFPHVARLRLIAACPDLDGKLGEAELRMIFDWILIQLHGRTHTSGYRELLAWTAEHGEAESLDLLANVTREAVDRLPRPVLKVIDACEGRIVAGVILDQALGESGRRRN